MRYRALSPTGDYKFGPGAYFLINTPQAVMQAILTRLKLSVGEWFLDNQEGLDKGNILGNGTEQTRDLEVQQRILGTTGVVEIVAYASSVSARAFTVNATINTLYGQATLTGTF